MTTIFLTLVCLATFSAAAVVQPSGVSTDAEVKDYTNCHPVSGDMLLYSGVVEKPYQLLQKVTADLSVNTSPKIIHCVRATNTNPDGHAAEVTVTQGGVDSSSITLHFESELMRGIYYNVTITGQ